MAVKYLKLYNLKGERFGGDRLCSRAKVGGFSKRHTLVKGRNPLKKREKVGRGV